MAGDIPNRNVGLGGSRAPLIPRQSRLSGIQRRASIITPAPEGVAGVNIGTDGIIQASGIGCSAILGGCVEEVAARVPAVATR